MKLNLGALEQTILGTIVIVLFAQISFDFSLSSLNIPITGQTLGVILVAFLANKYYGVLAVTLYLFLGGIGLPIFADGASGWGNFSEGSGGFLVGFLIAAIAIYHLKNYQKLNEIGLNILANLIGTAIILAFGVAWLSSLYGFEKGMEYGFYPFWIGAILKILIGISTITVYRKWTDKHIED